MPANLICKKRKRDRSENGICRDWQAIWSKTPLRRRLSKFVKFRL
jgi:recombinational DNA repair protein RecT